MRSGIGNVVVESYATYFTRQQLIIHIIIHVIPAISFTCHTGEKDVHVTWKWEAGMCVLVTWKWEAGMCVLVMYLSRGRQG